MLLQQQHRKSQAALQSLRQEVYKVRETPPSLLSLQIISHKYSYDNLPRHNDWCTHHWCVLCQLLHHAVRVAHWPHSNDLLRCRPQGRWSCDHHSSATHGPLHSHWMVQSAGPAQSHPPSIHQDRQGCLLHTEHPSAQVLPQTKTDQDTAVLSGLRSPTCHCPCHPPRAPWGQGGRPLPHCH